MKMEYLMMSASFECLEISRWSAADITSGGNIWSVTGKLSSGSHPPHYIVMLPESFVG